MTPINSRTTRNWLAYGLAASCVMVIGLVSRRYARWLPDWVALYAGDALWALMLYLVLGMMARTLSPKRLAARTLAIAYLVEFSQLYHAPWIDEIRHTRLGGLVLGYGFLWSDLACYAIGVMAGYLGECTLAVATEPELESSPRA